MAERKATNKYYPPDWDPSKGSLNKHLGQHPLRARARKLNEGILIIRFEMPFNVWCLHCNQHIGRGVRFNAEKKKVGDYYSTAIWSFRMKCHLCGGWMEIHTDPKNSEYICREGVRRKMEDVSAESLGLTPTLSLSTFMVNIDGVIDAELAKRMQNNPFFRIEHQMTDQRRASELVPKLSAIQAVNEKKWSRDYETSQSLRRKFREEKKVRKEECCKEVALKAKLAVDIPLQEERNEDRMMARNLVRERQNDAVQEAIGRIKNDSIFGKRTNRSGLSLNLNDADRSVIDSLDLAANKKR